MDLNVGSQPPTDGIQRGEIHQRNRMTTLWVWLCGICCLPSVLVAIAVVLVVSLIPIYISNRTVASAPYHDATIFSLAYATNYKGASAIKASNDKTIISQLEQALNLKNEISSLITFRLSSSGGASNIRRKKRQSSLQQCERNVTLDGRQIYIQFEVQIPKRFVFPASRTKFLTDIENIIRNVRTRFLLVISLENDDSITIELEFCSLERRSEPVTFQDPQSNTTTVTTTQPTTHTTTSTTTVPVPTCGKCAVAFEDTSAATTTTTTDYNYKDYNYRDYNANDHAANIAYTNSCEFFCNGASSGGTSSGCYVTTSNDRSQCVNYFTGDDEHIYTLTGNGACASPNAGYYCCCEPKSGR